MVVAAVLLAALVFASSAAAWKYKLTMPVAEQEARRYTKESCLEDVECAEWGVDCRRVNEQRVTCLEVHWYEVEPRLQYVEGEEDKCQWGEKLGVGRGGHVAVSFSKVSCEFVVP
jgi:C4-dicarboxylate-specific signal transduction histidine kinase